MNDPCSLFDKFYAAFKEQAVIYDWLIYAVVAFVFVKWGVIPLVRAWSSRNGRDNGP